MLQQDIPDDYVIATGVQHSVREFCEWAFAYAGIDLEWDGEGVEEKGFDVKTGKMRVAVNSEFYRPTDVVNLLGDPSKAKYRLGWDPLETSCEELCHIMVDHDLRLASAESSS